MKAIPSDRADTDVLTIIQRGTGDACARLIDRLEKAGDDDVRVTIISFEEQMRGWLAWIAKAKTVEQQVQGYLRLHALHHDFGTRAVLDFDRRSADVYSTLASQRIRIGTMDLRIASICLANNALLISRNTVHFEKVPGLRVDDWTA